MGLTGQGNFYLTVKEGLEGKPFLMLEPTGANKELLEGGHIVLTLREGTTFAGAQTLAIEMKKHITGATIAKGG
ncbi:hypothetical protein JKG68_31285 [Microvirga aerilata]|jgi:hypothetical protein|uniref:Uncharacterized protein n=1 Tax=Microvirga aerilata TaxID=670292 RepID=A0A937CZL1_9HYPH|nr:hypothetical protein [Microvirga aerilata]MBL0408358.1 hypothetical protein [Microvirga aerilata]